jgi:hypothetical protein
MIKLGDKEYSLSFGFEAIEGIQTDLKENDLSSLFASLAKALNKKESVTTKDLATMMRVGKVVIFHGLREQCLLDDVPMPYDTIPKVGARIKSMRDVGRAIGECLVEMNKLNAADEDAPPGEVMEGESPSPSIESAK